MMQRRFFTAGLVGSCCSMPWAYAQSPSSQNAVAGKDYSVLEPRIATTADKGQVEVLEFFGYWCPHCYALEPRLSEWVKTLPSWVKFDRVPVFFGPQTQHFQKLYYALEVMGKLPTLHTKVFDALHRDKMKMDNDAAVITWLSGQGIPAAQAQASLNAFGVHAKAKRAAQLTQSYQIEGVPTLAVAGRYLVSNGLRSLDVAKQLILISRDKT